jgi:ATPase subunit of ABC transporter with duplicated ATPase domains
LKKAKKRARGISISRSDLITFSVITSKFQKAASRAFPPITNAANFDERRTLYDAAAKGMGSENSRRRRKNPRTRNRNIQKRSRAVREETSKLQSTARALATLDALASLAEVAARYNFVCPTLHDGDEIEIKNGRHPIVEKYSSAASFVPNDLYMNNSTDRLLIITGANMGGKSTILRQIAIIQILAQIGSFVPADSARCRLSTASGRASARPTIWLPGVRRLWSK